MPNPKAPHPADFRDAQWIREATHFNAMVFIGRGQYDREDDFPTLAEAKVAALRIEARNPGRSALIYAVTAEGRSCIVTDALENLIMETQATTTEAAALINPAGYSAKSAAIRALKREGLEPDQAEVRNEGGRYFIRPPSAPKREPGAALGIPQIAAGAESKQIRKDKLRDAQAAVRARDPKQTAQAKPKRASDAKQPKTRAHYDRSGAKAAKAKPEARPAGSAPKRGAKAFEAALAEAKTGKLPAAPDFSAETHRPYRAKLARVTELAKAGDLKALRAETQDWKPYNSSMAPLIRFRDLCAEALAAKGRG